MIVYELSWWYLDEESGKSDEQVIAVYSSEQLAQKAIERFKLCSVRYRKGVVRDNLTRKEFVLSK